MIRTAHDAPGDALERGHDDKIAGEMEMARGIHAYLLKEYPGYPWHVHVDFRQGVAAVRLKGVMPDTQWYVLPLDKISTNSDMLRLVRNASGEILEKYGQRRGRLKPGDFGSLLAGKPWFDKKRLLS